ncbi:MAG: outer membrane protein assembly factor BamA [Acetobacteraceae bacterium]
MSRFRATLLVVCLLPLLPAAVVYAQAPARARSAAVARTPGGIVQAIRVEGNRRIDAGTIRSYMLIQPGQPFDPAQIDRSVKTLYATGLFQDVSITPQGDTLVVHVTENPIVNRVVFEGNHAQNDTQLSAVTQLRSRSVFTPAAAEADRQRILNSYAAKGRYDATVEPEIIRLPENRVNLVFRVHDGPETLISRIVFVGNHAYGEGALADVVNSRPQRWWAFLSTADQYTAEKLGFDKELLRRFYLQHGYVDFEVTSATAELAPDRKSFFVSFVLHEGERYRVGKITINSQLKGITAPSLRGDLKLAEGDWYNGDAVGRSADAMEDDIRTHGFAFIQVTPRIVRDAKAHTVSLTFDATEGPRVYVERINITGNTRTEDKVIRREFRIAEGDAYNQELLRRSRQRLQDLDYFNSVNITTEPGAAPDKAVINTNVDEKSTGQFSLGGGYSTDAGFLISTGIRESNFIGTGIDAGINGVLAQKQSSINLSINDPYFLGKNLLAGFDAFLIQTNSLGTEPYNERRVGFTTRLGYDINEHLKQVWSYSLVNRTVYDITTTDFYILSEAGTTLLSQISQVISLDERDSKLAPHRGYLLSFGSDLAGFGGNARFARTRVDGSYYIPLDYFSGNSDWGIALSAGAGYLFNMGRQESVIDRFYLGGDNLRGFEIGGAGPHVVNADGSVDSVGGRFIYTQSSELRFPLPLPQDLGLSGRAFVDVGSLSQGSFESANCQGAPNGVCPPVFQSAAPRVGAGVGVSWKTPFGLINIDLAPFVVKQKFDQTQIFRFSFGTRF